MLMKSKRCTRGPNLKQKSNRRDRMKHWVDHVTSESHEFDMVDQFKDVMKLNYVLCPRN
jgi:hypothetical protein